MSQVQLKVFARAIACLSKIGATLLAYTSQGGGAPAWRIKTSPSPPLTISSTSPSSPLPPLHRLRGPVRGHATAPAAAVRQRRSLRVRHRQVPSLLLRVLPRGGGRGRRASRRRGRCRRPRPRPVRCAGQVAAAGAAPSPCDARGYYVRDRRVQACRAPLLRPRCVAERRGGGSCLYRRNVPRAFLAPRFSPRSPARVTFSPTLSSPTGTGGRRGLLARRELSVLPSPGPPRSLSNHV